MFGIGDQTGDNFKSLLSTRLENRFSAQVQRRSMKPFETG